MAKEQKQSIDLRPGKRFSTALSNENLRIGEDSAWSAKIAGTLDKTRSKLDFEIGKGGVVTNIDQSRSIPKRIKAILEKYGISDPNQGLTDEQLEQKGTGVRTYASFILQGSHDTMRGLAFGEQFMCIAPNADNSHLERGERIEKWAKDMYNYIAEKYGEDRIAAFVVHLDETTPHAHCVVVPIDQEGKLSFKNVFAGNDKYEFSKRTKQLWDEAALIAEKYGMKRGDDKLTTGAKHKSYLHWMREQIASNSDTIKVQVQTIAENKEQLYLINAAIKRADTKLKGLTTMIKNLETQKQEINKQIANLEEDLVKGQASNDEKLKMLKEQLEKIETDIEDKNEKLQEATKELQDLAQRKLKLKTKYEKLMRDTNEDLTERLVAGSRQMSVTLWDETVKNFKKDKADFEQFSRELPPNLRVKFDSLLEDSLLVEMADHGNEIAATATALFLGYVDKAMNYAESNGGGGASPGTGWGRKEDEDEEAYKRRCCIMGRMMMRPAGRKLKRS